MSFIYSFKQYDISRYINEILENPEKRIYKYVDHNKDTEISICLLNLSSKLTCKYIIKSNNNFNCLRDIDRTFSNVKTNAKNLFCNKFISHDKIVNNFIKELL